MTRYESRLAGNTRASRAWYRFARAIVVGATRGFTRMRIIDAHHVPDHGAFVLAPVHRSYIDTPISAAVTRRRLRFMGKDSLWKYRSSAWLLSALGGFPVSRGTADREALKRCLAVLEAGEPVIQPLFSGAVYVAAKAGVSIVPVGIGGSEDVMPKGVRFPRPRRVVVVVGEPITVGEPGTALTRRQITEAVESLSQVLQELFDRASDQARAPRRRT
jgi:1-acyl-sn-glycerol-3-phosphate acyltransferase